MCRLLGVVTRALLPLSTALGELAAPFTELSREHGDGWGIAAWPENSRTGLRVVKGTGRAVGDEMWDRALAGTPTSAVIRPALTTQTCWSGSGVGARRPCAAG